MPKNKKHELGSEEYFRSISIGDIVTSTENNYRKGKPAKVIAIGKATLDEYKRLKVQTQDNDDYFTSQKNLVYLEDFKHFYFLSLSNKG